MMEFKISAMKTAIIFGIGLCLFPVIIESQQMCWTCQFVLYGPGSECTTEPANWTMGDPRMNCSTTNTTKCIITAEFDAASGAPTFFYRGCGEFTQEDGCTDGGVSHTCFYSCENEDYCNDKSLPVSPIMEDNTDGRTTQRITGRTTQRITGWTTQRIATTTTTSCGGIYTGTEGQIQSPNFPNPYPDYSECYYHIEVPVMSTVVLTFTSFYLENAADCNYDYVVIYDGTSTSAPMLGSRRCGARSPFEVQSTGNTMLVKFETDGSVGHNGFNATFTAVEGEVDGVIQCYQCVNYDQDWNYYPQCPKDAQFTNTSQSNCAGRCFTRSDDYDDRWVVRGCTMDQLGLPSPLPEDGCYTYHGSVWCICSTSGCNSAALGQSTGVELDAHITTAPAIPRITSTTASCGGIYTGTEGQIQSPNFPNPYPDYSECFYHIEVPVMSTVVLIFTSFRLEDAVGCNYDYIVMYDGTSTSAPMLGSRRCGTRSPFEVQSTGNTMLVEFVTDSSVSYNGFNATFTAVEREEDGVLLCYQCANYDRVNYQYMYNPQCPKEAWVTNALTANCSDRCYTRSFDWDTRLVERGCTADQPSLPSPLPEDGCYTYYGSVWCICSTSRCNRAALGEPMDMELDGHNIYEGAASGIDVSKLYGFMFISLMCLLKLWLSP